MVYVQNRCFHGRLQLRIPAWHLDMGPNSRGHFRATSLTDPPSVPKPGLMLPVVDRSKINQTGALFTQLALHVFLGFDDDLGLRKVMFQDTTICQSHFI